MRVVNPHSQGKMIGAVVVTTHYSPNLLKIREEKNLLPSRFHTEASWFPPLSSTSTPV